MKTVTAAERKSLIRLAASIPKGQPERKALLRVIQSYRQGALSVRRLVFHAETPRGATVVKAYDEGDGNFYWEETERGRGTSHSPVASGSLSSEQNLVTVLNNHFRSYREFDPRKFKVFVNDVGVQV